MLKQVGNLSIGFSSVWKQKMLPTLSRGEALVNGPANDIQKSLVINTIK